MVFGIGRVVEPDAGRLGDDAEAVVMAGCAEIVGSSGPGARRPAIEAALLEGVEDSAERTSGLTARGPKFGGGGELRMVIGLAAPVVAEPAGGRRAAGVAGVVRCRRDRRVDRCW